MIAHVVLFEPRPDLSDAERTTFISTLERALAEIPVIRRARVGRRATMGRLYDTRNSQNSSFVAILEFDDETALRTYLDHPAHTALGEQFYRAGCAALAFDFVLKDATDVRALF